MNKSIFGPQEKLITEINEGFIEDKQENIEPESPHLDMEICQPINISLADLMRKPILYSLIRKFYKRLRNNIPLYKFKRLEKKHYDFIDDKSYFLEEKEETKSYFFQDYILSKAKKAILSPYHPLRLIWSFIMICFTLFCLLYTPFEISFQAKSDFTELFPLIGTIIFALDIGISLITGTFSKGSLLLDPRKSIRAYLHHSFIYDFFALMSFIYWLIFENTIKNHLWMELGKTLVFFKMKKISFCQRTLSNAFKTKINYKGYLELLKVMGLSLVIAHFIACFWHITSFYDKETNWKTSLQLNENNSIWTIYIYSIYWAVATMMTVGYGDVTARNEAEILVSLIVIVFGCVVYAYNLNSVGIVIQEIYKNKRDFQKKMKIMNNFMNRKRIDNNLQNRIQEYLHFIWMEQKNNEPSEELEIINSLSESLRSELLVQSYTEIFEKFPLLVKYFSQKTLLKMISIIKEIKYTPGEEIFEEDSSENCCLFYIIKGSVDLILQRQRNNVIVKELNKDESFGEYSFFTKKHQYSCRAKSFTSIYAIPSKEFLEIIRENPEDYEAYCMIRDSLLFNNEQNFIQEKCFSCNRYTHQISQCPLLHYVPDKEKVIKQYEFYNDQGRNSHLRKAKHRFPFKKINFSANLIQKNIEKNSNKCFYDDFRESRVNESFNNLESQNFDNFFLDLKLKETKNLTSKNLENEEEGILLKKSVFMNKNLDKSTYHNLDCLEEEEEEEVELQGEENNEEINENLIDLRKKESSTKISYHDKKCMDNKLTHKRSQDDFPSKKSFENIIDNKDNKNGVAHGDKQEEKNIIFEKMYHFQMYFPEMNYKKAIRTYDFQRISNIIISMKSIKPKLPNFNKYSFRTSRYKEIILKSYEDKKLIPSRRNIKKKTMLTMLNMESSPRKKSYFKSPKFQEIKKKPLEDLIASLLNKKKKNLFKNSK